MNRSPKQKVNALLDVFHKGFVWTCIGMTLYGTSYLGYRFYKYYTQRRPLILDQKKLADMELLSEGSSENIKDLAPSL